jgi:hypothetical protein
MDMFLHQGLCRHLLPFSLNLEKWNDGEMIILLTGKRREGGLGFLFVFQLISLFVVLKLICF